MQVQWLATCAASMATTGRSQPTWSLPLKTRLGGASFLGISHPNGLLHTWGRGQTFKGQPCADRTVCDERTKQVKLLYYIRGNLLVQRNPVLGLRRKGRQRQNLRCCQRTKGENEFAPVLFALGPKWHRRRKRCAYAPAGTSSVHLSGLVRKRNHRAKCARDRQAAGQADGDRAAVRIRDEQAGESDNDNHQQRQPPRCSSLQSTCVPTSSQDLHFAQHSGKHRLSRLPLWSSSLMCDYYCSNRGRFAHTINTRSNKQKTAF